MTLPELPPSRRKQTAQMLCTFLGVTATEKQLALIADVLLAGELDFALFCHRRAEDTQSGAGYHNYWKTSMVSAFESKLQELAYVKEAFSATRDGV